MTTLLHFEASPQARARLAARAAFLPADPVNPTPRQMGRLAPHQGLGPETCPYPPLSPAGQEWSAGWAEGYGIPSDLQGRADFLRDKMLELADLLEEIRASGPPEVSERIAAYWESTRRPRGNLVPLQVSL